MKLNETLHEEDFSKLKAVPQSQVITKIPF